MTDWETFTAELALANLSLDKHFWPYCSSTLLCVDGPREAIAAFCVRHGIDLGRLDCDTTASGAEYAFILAEEVEARVTGVPLPEASPPLHGPS